MKKPVDLKSLLLRRRDIIEAILVMAMGLSIGLFSNRLSPTHLFMIAFLSLALLIGLVNLDFLLILTILFLPVARFFYFYIFSLSFKLPELVALLMIAIYYLRGLMRGDLSINSPLKLPIFLFLFISFISLLVNLPHLTGELPHYEGFEGGRTPLPYALIQIPWGIFCFLLAVIVEKLINTKEKLKKMLNVLFISTAAACVCGFYEIIRFYLGGIQPHRYFSVGGFMIPKMSSLEYEASIFGSYLGMVFFFIFAEFLNSARGTLRRQLLKALIILVSVSLFFTFSILAWLTWLFGLIVFLILRIKIGHLKIARLFNRFFIYLLICILCASVVFYIFPKGYEFFKQGSLFTLTKVVTGGGSVGGRSYYTMGGLKAFLDNPWIGLGPAQMRFNMYRYANLHPDTLAPAAFNLFVDILAELGIIGFFAFLFILYRVLSPLLIKLRSAANSNRALLLIAAISSIGAAYFSMMGIDNFYRVGVWFIFGLVLAIAKIDYPD